MNNVINPNFPGLDPVFDAGQRVTVRTSRFAFNLATGATIAQLVDPFGSGSTYEWIGALPPQLALSGDKIVRGSGVPNIGDTYTIIIVATSPDGVRQAPVRLSFRADLPFGGVAVVAPAAPSLAFVVTVISVLEGNSGTNAVSNTLNVTRNGVTGPLTINFAYSGTASAGLDYTAPSSVTIPANASTVSFDISVIGDTIVEPDETIIIDATIAGYAVNARKTITLLNDDLSATPETVGGLATGTVATSGPLNGLMFTTGDDFEGQLKLVGPAARDRFNPYLTTRGVYIPKGAGQAPRSSERLGGTDADPNWTGHNNSNRGAPIASMADMITQTDSKIILKQRPMLESEKAHVLRNNRSVLSSMISTALKDMMRAPGAFEWEEKRNTIAQDHFTGWTMDRWSWSLNEVEADAEAGSHPTGDGDGRDVEFNINTWADGIRQVDRSSGGEVNKVEQTVTHRYIFNHTADGVIEFYLDGVLKRTFAGEPALVLRQLKQLIFTAHCYDVDRPQVETTYEILLWRYWAKNGHFKPRVAPMVIQAAAGASFNVALPGTVALWGRAVNEDMSAVMCEPNEPGGTTNGVQYGDAPPGMTLDRTNLSISGSSMTPGRVQFARAADEPGYTSGVHRFVVEIGPVINISELNVTQGVQVDIDIYKMIDFGILVTDGDKPNTTITISSLPNGLEFSNTTGRLTGLTNASVGSQPVTISATNGVGQQATASAALKINAKPTTQTYEYMSYPDLIADFDGDRDDRFASQTGAINAWLNVVANAGDLSKPASVSVSPERVTGVKAGRSAVLFRRGADGATSTVLESPQNCLLTSMMQGTDPEWTLLLVSCPLAALTGSVAGWGEQIDNGAARNTGLIRRSPGTGSTPVVSSMRAGNTTQTSANLSVGPIPDGAWNVTLLRHKAGVSDAWVNRVRVAEAVAHSSTTVWTAANRFGIGNLQGGTGQASRYPGTGFDGYVGQIIAFRVALSDTQSALLMNNMHSKWSIA